MNPTFKGPSAPVSLSRTPLAFEHLFHPSLSKAPLFQFPSFLFPPPRLELMAATRCLGYLSAAAVVTVQSLCLEKPRVIGMGRNAASGEGERGEATDTKEREKG